MSAEFTRDQVTAIAALAHLELEPHELDLFAKQLSDILAYADFFFLADDEFPYDEKDFAKRVATPEAKALLTKFREKLSVIEPFEVEPLEAMLKTFVEEQGIKIGDIVHAVRVAISGKGVGPGLYDCLAILGRESSLRRIDRALAK